MGSTALAAAVAHTGIEVRRPTSPARDKVKEVL